jgi:hypothetical protein
MATTGFRSGDLALLPSGILSQGTPSGSYAQPLMRRVRAGRRRAEKAPVRARRHQKNYNADFHGC